MNRFLSGKLKYLTLFCAGGVADLALAPFYIFPVLFISFPLFYKILIDARSKKQAFFIGWTFGFGYFVFGLYWIANSLLVDAEKFAWLIPFAVCGIPFGLAIYIGLFGLVFRISGRYRGPLLFATLWVVFELIRTFFLTGFPWNLIGYTALFWNQFAQLAALGGVYLLSFVIILIVLIPAYIKNRRLLISVMLMMAGIIIFTYHHLKFDGITTQQAAKVIIFQPNVEQTLKWDPLAAKKQFIENIDYGRRKEFAEADLVLWPETGVPYYLNKQPLVTELLQHAAPENGVLITGGLRSEGETHESYRVWNTLYAISRGGVYQSYDKIHLVPFGEFVPFRQYLPLDKITPGSLDFSTGGKREVIKYKNGPGFLPLICYEVIFPEFSHSETQPDFLVNITNDGWFGNSTGPYQHLAMAQMRAIEQGIPLLRAANTGISAVIDPNGNIQSSIPYGKRDFLVTTVTLTKYSSVYNKYGDVFIFGLLIISAGSLVISGKRRKI